MKKIIGLLICLFVLLLSIPNARSENDPFASCPLLREEMMAIYYLDDNRSFWIWHRIDKDQPLPDVLVLYEYDLATDEIYETIKLWLKAWPEKERKDIYGNSW